MSVSCRQCSARFSITKEEMAFLDELSPVIPSTRPNRTTSGRASLGAGREKKYSIPAPTLCPDCRLQRRCLWRGELHLFKRKSDCSGKDILSFYPPEAPCTVYAQDEWLSDDWDPLSYGRDVDFSRPFFDQFAELLRVVPIPALSTTGTENNSDYINSASWNKNCYLIAAANHDEDCYYGHYINHCKDCVDCSYLESCELCYECVDSEQCYNLRYCSQCVNCSDSLFLHGCRGCSHCFGSVNLTEQKYVYLNEQLTKEEYERRMAGLHRRSRVEEAKKFFRAHRLKYPHRFMVGEMNENVTGNCLWQCRNTFDCFDATKLEDCRYCTWLHEGKSCQDCIAWGFPVEQCYECLEVGDGSHRTMFSVTTYRGENVRYCMNVRNSTEMFGCVSVRNGRFCILNKQYSKEEYEELLPRLIEHMMKDGEWGEFFPIGVAPLAYNQSIAQDYFPLTKEQAVRLGARWGEEAADGVQRAQVPVPDSVRDASPSICGKVLTCEATGRPYKIIPQEFAYYKAHDIPLPAVSFNARDEQRRAARSPHCLWDRQCGKCKKSIRTPFAPERPEIVYCDECYRKEIY